MKSINAKEALKDLINFNEKRITRLEIDLKVIEGKIAQERESLKQLEHYDNYLDK